MKKMLLIILLGLSVICICSCKKPKKNDVKLASSFEQRDKVMKNFSCELTNGKNFDLYNRKNEKPVFVYFWAIWCTSCESEMKELEKIYNSNKNKMDFIFINCGDSKDAVDKYIKEKKFILPIGYDEKKVISRKNKVVGMPTTYIVNKDNVVKKVILGTIKGSEHKKNIEKVLNNK